MYSTNGIMKITVIFFYLVSDDIQRCIMLLVSNYAIYCWVKFLIIGIKM